jgi:hypothetical protein
MSLQSAGVLGDTSVGAVYWSSVGRRAIRFPKGKTAEGPAVEKMPAVNGSKLFGAVNGRPSKPEGLALC